MKHYCETIPVTLAEKLKEKGMPLGSYVWLPNGMASRKDEANLAYFDDQLIPYCTYADVLDWMMERGYLIVILRSEGRWCYWVGLTTDYDTYDDTYEIEGEDFDTWHEAANAAIEKTLELI